jgi:tellurium resistance protein TerD
MSPVSLEKGGKVDLSKEAGGTLSALKICLGWDAKSGQVSGFEYDLDASIFALGADGKVLTDDWFVFYGNEDSPGGVIHHNGDNLTGAGDGDDEVIDIDLASLPAEVVKLVIAVTIFEAEKRKQTFGQMDNSFVRAVDASNGAELARYDLDMDFSMETAVVFASVDRRGSSWVLSAKGDGYPSGLRGLGVDFGVNVA